MRLLALGLEVHATGTTLAVLAAATAMVVVDFRVVPIALASVVRIGEVVVLVLVEVVVAPLLCERTQGNAHPATTLSRGG